VIKKITSGTQICNNKGSIYVSVSSETAFGVSFGPIILKTISKKALCALHC
jgi:hypothetical protein